LGRRESTEIAPFARAKQKETRDTISGRKSSWTRAELAQFEVFGGKVMKSEWTAAESGGCSWSARPNHELHMNSPDGSAAAKRPGIDRKLSHD